VSTGDTPQGPPTSAKAAADDESPASSQPPGSDAAPGSTPAPTADGPADPPPSTPSSASTPPGSGDTPPSSQPDSIGGGSDDCAEIPTAAHVVLTAEIKLVVQIPFATEAAVDPSHELTLTNDDGSYAKTLTFASDCQAGDISGTSVMVFDGLTDGHTYSLHGKDDNGGYTIFDKIPYHELVTKLATQGGAMTTADPDQHSASDRGSDDGGGTTDGT